MVAATQGRTRQAVRLYAAFDKLLESGNAYIAYRQDKEAYQEHLAFVRVALDERDFAAAWAAGLAMSPEEAIAYALEEDV